VPHLRLLIALPLTHLREVALRSLLKPLVHHLESGLTLLALVVPVVYLLELLDSFEDLSATELISDVVIQAVRDLLGQRLVLLKVLLLIDN
jgi:hypothetical protein